ncbi:hypothetical protein L1987_46236 [Smallanthus sonchifolius]|uniref:Uncharacterized protein n=1 Tax=Smallanthus sonchifolius TaxID=185202 RepID=A0ACB9FZQ5_9ASTR|nr:hypothetical protein L1987_46236 [Smallanthus sonchifolius]
MLKYSSIIGSSHGLLCLHSCYLQSHDGVIRGRGMAVIWNISTRKAVAVVMPNVPHIEMCATTLGFGVCSETTDIKIVKITHKIRNDYIGSRTCNPWQVEVFTLSIGAWRSSYTTNLPCKSIKFYSLQVVVDGFLYWLATERIAMDGGLRPYNLIISFDITSEEFGEVKLPGSLALLSIFQLSVSKLRESLVVLEDGEDFTFFVVWMMEDGAPKSFTRLFTVNSLDAIVRSVPGFRKSGELVIEIVQHCTQPAVYDFSLVVYEPYSKHMRNLGINGRDGSFEVYPYMETLLLHDQQNFTVYDNGRHYISKCFF